MNQSINQHNMNTRTISMARDDFSPEIHVLAGTPVPVVSTNTWWFGG
jgi:hypothetical protein